jgi:SNF2 family DNA or RNA helicase
VGELSGEPVLVAYQFRHEAERILKDKRFKGFVWFSSKLNEREANQLIDDWVAGKVPGIIGHPASVGHGIDRLQHGGRTVIWYGAPWSYRLYHQTNGRLRRDGQTKPVLVPRILVRNTVDEVVRTALDRKEEDERSVRQAIMDYWKAKQATSPGA